MRNFNLRLCASFFVVICFITSCSEDSELFEDTSTDVETSLESSLSARTTVDGDKILDIDYCQSEDMFIIAVDRADEVSFHYSLPSNRGESGWWKDWTTGSGVAKGSEDATPFLGSAWDSYGNAIRVAKHASSRLIHVLPGQIKNGRPIFRGGTRRYKVGDLAEFIDINYDSATDIFVITGKTMDDSVKTYYCMGASNWKNWTEVTKKYSAGYIESGAGDYKGAAWGSDGNFIFAYRHPGEDVICVLPGVNKNGVPRFQQGSRTLVGDLEELVDIDYNANNKYYTITGYTANKELKTYYSPENGSKSWKNWDEIARSRSASTTAGTYFGSAWSADGYFITGFIAARNNLPSVTRGVTNNGKPRFLPGREPL